MKNNYFLAIVSIVIVVFSGCTKSNNNIVLKDEGSLKNKTINSLGRISNIKVDSKNDIYILDLTDKKIVVIDSLGNYKFSFGKAGEAPGEFSGPRQLNIGKNDFIIVSDLYNHKLVVFDSIGKYQCEIRRNINNPTFAVNDSSIIVPNYEGDQLFAIYNYSGKLLYKAGKKEQLTPTQEKSFESKYNRIHAILVNRDTIYVSYEYSYLIEKYDMKGNLIKKIFPPKKLKDIPMPKNENNTTIIRYAPYSLLLTRKGYLLHWIYEDNNSNNTKDFAFCDIFNSDGKFIKRLNTRAIGWCIDKNDRIYMADYKNDSIIIRKYKLDIK